jgi:translation initiation factor 3 subunit H
MVSGSLLGLVVQHGNKSILEITHTFPFPSDQYTSKSQQQQQQGVNETSNETIGVEDSNAVVVTATTTTTSAASAAMAAAAATVATYDGHEYQIEMMRMLREVNVDNNCVGWYQSMYLGLYNTTTMVENQLNYQTELSHNSVVILYDPIQTAAQQTLILKCYRLSEECIEQQQNSSQTNTYLDPKQIFEEIPVTFTNPGLIQAFLYDIADGLHRTTTTSTTTTTTSAPIATSMSTNTRGRNDTISTAAAAAATVVPNTDSMASHHLLETSHYDTLDLSCQPYLEKQLDFLSTVVEDLTLEQHKFTNYTRQVSRLSGTNLNSSNSSAHNNNNNNKKNTMQKVPPLLDPIVRDHFVHHVDAPRRFESLLYNNQIHTYVQQMDICTNDTLSKLFLTHGLQTQTQTTTTPKSSLS